ncbi:MAG TPA: 4'-phosphopantetheinyl transferase superfamily protein [Candidatus Dormibacteraeota bacterium]|nr:4'-phosphopantetheinyl transferase superfamily protein [Candidatus Dormibacteraeota bacterium]
MIDVYRVDGVEPGRDVLSEVLARHLGVPAAGIVVVRRCAICGGQHGKPFLDPRVHGQDAPQFSLSRSGDVAVVAIAASPVGIDVEAGRSVDAAAIAAHLFTADEAKLVAGLDRGAGLALFMRLWTRKEALGKAAGCGLSDDVLRTDVSGLPGRLELGGLGSWTVVDLELGDGLTAALAARDGVESVRVLRL